MSKDKEEKPKRDTPHATPPASDTPHVRDNEEKEEPKNKKKST